MCIRAHDSLIYFGPLITVQTSERWSSNPIPNHIGRRHEYLFARSSRPPLRQSICWRLQEVSKRRGRGKVKTHAYGLLLSKAL